MKGKYRDKTFTLAELHDERVRLEKKYGERIILGTLEDMVTEEERLDKVEYDTLTGFIHDASAEMKKADENYVKAIKTHLILNRRLHMLGKHSGSCWEYSSC